MISLITGVGLKSCGIFDIYDRFGVALEKYLI